MEAYNKELANNTKLKADIQLSQSLVELNHKIRDIAISDSNMDKADDGSTESMVTRAGLLLDRVDLIAKKSKNIKGELVKALRDSTAAVKDIVGALAGRSTDDEVRALRAANQRFNNRVEDLQKQLEGLTGRINSAGTGKITNPGNPKYTQ